MSPASRPDTIRLLIAEDDPLARRLLSAQAGQRGFIVIGETASGPGAVAKTKTLRPDAILMDIEMPGFNGLEAIRRIQRECPTPAIVVTAHDSRDLATTIADSGACACLLKPVDPSELVHAVSIARARHHDLVQLRHRVAQRDLRVREVYHRVGNQLGATASLIHLSAIRQTEPGRRLALLDCEARVRTMARIHALLHQAPDQADIPLAPYLFTLSTELVAGLRPDLTCQTHTPPGAPIPVDSFIATTCGLLTHELVMNAIRHAFPGGRTGTIRVSLAAKPPSHLQLTIHDNGIGLPDTPARARPTSLGLTLVASLARDLQGTLSRIPAPQGTAFTLVFPLTPAKDTQ